MEYDKTTNERVKEILFSRTVKAGQRIYYIDVKKNRMDDMFLAITESKKVIAGEGENQKVNYEKHKIFLYKEDFAKFMEAMQQTLQYIEDNQGKAEERPDNDREIRIDMDF